MTRIKVIVAPSHGLQSQIDSFTNSPECAAVVSCTISPVTGLDFVAAIVYEQPNA